MKSVEERIEEFCIYHRDGDGECNNVVLKAWANKHCKTLQDMYELAYFFSITYCVGSAVVLFRERGNIFPHISEWVSENKHKLVFQSDRKYIRMLDSFEKVLAQFEHIRSVDDFLKRVTEGNVIALNKAIKYVSSWELFGRFSAFLFLETFVELTGIPVENTTIVWKKGNTATSGLMNVYGLDKQAAHFDKTTQLLVPADKMDDMLKALIGRILITGGKTNVTEVETSLCAYRKFYKGSRYNGYYLDRMLEEIYSMQPEYPEIARELLEIRGRSFDAKYLGEVSGWRGIRKELKKAYIRTGEVT